MSRFTLAGLPEHVSSGAPEPYKLQHLSTMGSSSQRLLQNPEGHFQKALSRQEAGATTSRSKSSKQQVMKCWLVAGSGKCVELKVAKVGGQRVAAAWIAVVYRRWRPLGAKVLCAEVGQGGVAVQESVRCVGNFRVE